MTLYMHQWRYKDQHVRDMVNRVEDIDRARVVRTAIEACHGRLVAFYFAFGEYDGVSISEFADEANALACAMLLVGQGRIQSLHTTTLFDPTTFARAIETAHMGAGLRPPLAGDS